MWNIKSLVVFFKSVCFCLLKKIFLKKQLLSKQLDLAKERFSSKDICESVYDQLVLLNSDLSLHMKSFNHLSLSHFIFLWHFFPNLLSER